MSPDHNSDFKSTPPHALDISLTPPHNQKMSLIVLPALPPDALSLSLLRHAAFASSNAIYMLAYQDVSLPTLLAAELEASERDLTSSRTVPIECLKVIDTQTGEIVSTAKWHLPYNAPTGETKPKYEGADGVRELAYPEGTNKAILLEYERLAGDMNSQAWKGKRCYRNYLLSFSLAPLSFKPFSFTPYTIHSFSYT